jgi:ubiquinone/menaquinone biosynthesis C-methylase UbiE
MFSDPESVIAQSYVGEGMTVADFGAGAGFYALALSKRVGEYGRVFAIDVLPDHLKKLVNEASRAGLHNIEVIQSDLETEKGSGLLTASVDRIIIANTLFQADHPEKIVNEAKRVLKASGKVAVIDWVDSFNQIGPHPDNVITKDEARKHFEKAGFVLESFIDAGSHHYGMLYVLTPKPLPGASKNMKVTKSEKDMNPGLIVPPVSLRG